MSNCRSCGAKIHWVEVRSGKKMPVDPEPIDVDDMEDGMIVVTADGEIVRSEHGRLYVPGGKAWKGEGKGIEGFISHFATCPQANEWRRHG